MTFGSGQYIGFVRPGRTLYFVFSTYNSSNWSSITASDFAVGDIKVYKDGSMTQRASTSGYTLLDTDGLDLDGNTGIHGFSIDLSDNDEDGFWQSGSRYFVVVGPITVSAQTVNLLAGEFHIGYDQALVNTTIATLASQTSFTLSKGSTDDSAYVGCVVIVDHKHVAYQHTCGIVSAYTGATKTVTLSSNIPFRFTVGAGDHISIMPHVSGNACAVGGLIIPSGAIPAAVAGAAGGVFIAGTNAATSVTTALTANVVGNITGNLSGSVGSLGATAKNDVNAEVDTALNTAIPGSPTANSINQRVAAIDDLVQASGGGDLAAVKAVVDKVDTMIEVVP